MPIPHPTDPSALDDETLRNHPSFASTLASGLALLGCFSGGEAWLGNAEIAAQLGLTRPTVSRLAFTLIGLGYLRRDKRTGKYQLGPAVLSLGYPLLNQLSVRQVAADDMQALARHARGPISIGVRDRLQVVYVETTMGRQSNMTRPGIGSTRPLLRTALGRALLAAHDEAERTAVERRLAVEMPEEWAQFQDGAARAREEIRTLGFCIVAGDWKQTLAAVAVPMSLSVAGLPLAFNLTVPSFSTTREQLTEDLGPRLVELVRRAEQQLGRN